MKQMLLRVPEELHRRLVARAQRSQRSLNSVATEILDAAVDTDEGDRRARLRATATLLELNRSPERAPTDPTAREQVIATTRGLGPLLDRYLDDERSRV